MCRRATAVRVIGRTEDDSAAIGADDWLLAVCDDADRSPARGDGDDLGYRVVLASRSRHGAREEDRLAVWGHRDTAGAARIGSLHERANDVAVPRIEDDHLVVVDRDNLARARGSFGAGDPHAAAVVA